MDNFSPDMCFNEMAEELFPSLAPEDVGYIKLLEEVKRIKKWQRVVAARQRDPQDLTNKINAGRAQHRAFQNLKQEIQELKNKLLTANNKIKALQKKIDEIPSRMEEELKETYFQRGFDAGKEEYEVDTELLNEKEEENKKLQEEQEEKMEDTLASLNFYKECNEELKEQVSKLERWSRAKTEVNMFLSLQWKELITSQDLSQMSGLGKDLGTDIAIVDIAEKFVKHEEENKKLKEQHEETLGEVREYLGRFNGDEVQVFDKIVKSNSN